ncbi:MAG: acylneuraminate cytidylyltransferase family protein [Desulfobacteraceae bacterium]|nr:acylneuraminate cytidylyltransferase family protein [Desulfobacteraceae bacterium]
MKPYTVGFIFARGGSKGVLRKNIRPLADRPLIAYAIDTGLQSQFINRVVVSTDDQEIAQIAKNLGAEVAFLRPKELARDNSPELLSWKHAICNLNAHDRGQELDVFVSIPPTAPLRAIEHVDNCISTFMESNVDVVITVKKTSRHPSFNMIILDEENYAKLLYPTDKKVTHRQEPPPVYDVTTVAYVARPKFILEAKSSIYEGKLKAVLIPEERALDIDTELDFQFAEFLLAKRGLGNK